MCIRDRYGITQLAFNEGVDAKVLTKVRLINRESVIQVEGVVVEREKKNKALETGEIEIRVTSIKTLSSVQQKLLLSLSKKKLMEEMI